MSMVTHFGGADIDWSKVYAAKFYAMGPAGRLLQVWVDIPGKAMPIEMKAVADIGAREMDDSLNELADRRRLLRAPCNEGGRGMRAFYFDPIKIDHPMDLPEPVNTGLPGDRPNGKITFNLSDGGKVPIEVDYWIAQVMRDWQAKQDEPIRRRMEAMKDLSAEQLERLFENGTASLEANWRYRRMVHLIEMLTPMFPKGAEEMANLSNDDLNRRVDEGLRIICNIWGNELPEDEGDDDDSTKSED